MALRVLLADESTTIKKVMQLALQDFAVEVKAVHAGVDVLDVARTFQPDMIFADVLLQKKNGYEVCAMLKADHFLKSIPVVLMWSSFMDLDDSLARNAGAEGRLEKPFDVETLRKIVLELVPKTRSQRLAHFLEFPVKANEELREEEDARSADTATGGSVPDFSVSEVTAVRAAPPHRPIEQPVAPVTPRAAPPPAPSPAAPAIPMPDEAETPASWGMESFDDPSEFADEVGFEPLIDPMADRDDDEEVFQPLELSQLGRSRPATAAEEPAPAVQLEPETVVHTADDEVWTHQDLSRFKLDLPPVTVDGGEGSGDFNIDMGQDEFTSSGQPSRYVEPPYVAPTALKVDRTNPMFTALPPDVPPPPLIGRTHQAFGDLQSDLHADYDDAPEIELPVHEPVFGDDELSLESTTLGHPRTDKIEQMDAGRLEEIIRAQSRDIIEAVVRKIVPDLATAIIREELERLLEDTALREARQGRFETTSSRAGKGSRP